MNSKPEHTSNPSATAWLVALLLLAGAVAPASAANVTLTNSDALGVSSFTDTGGATNWDSGLPPVAGNAYYTTNFTLRTPTGGGNYTFAGDSLEVDANGGALGIKGFGTITVNNLILSNCRVANSGTGGNPDTALLAGNINVIAGSTLDGGATTGITALNVLAPITGTGGITIQNNGTVIYSANNTYTGATSVATNSTLKMGIANAMPNGTGVGTLTLGGGVAVGAVLDLNGFDTTVNELASGGGAVPATVINSAVGTSNTLTVYTELFNRNFKGYIRDNNGTGGILSVTKTGTGFWLVSSNMTYSGNTTINAGSLNLGASGNVLPWGAGKGNMIINSPGTLNLSGRSPQLNGLFGDGTVDVTATSGRGTLHCGSNDVTSVFSGTIQNSQGDPVANTAIITFQKWGAGTVTLTGNNSFNGPVLINAGILRITQSTGLGAVPKTGINKISSALGDAQLHLLGTNGDLTLDPGIAFQGFGTNGAIVNEAGNNTVGGSIYISSATAGMTIRSEGDTLNLAGNISLQTNVTSGLLTLGGATNGTVNGVISDTIYSIFTATNLSLTKAGAGKWTLTTNNTYTGNTTINGGTLALAATASISNTPTVNLQNSATFDVSAVGGWTLGSGQTLKGNGTVMGNVTANGTVAPGTGIGTLTFANHVTLAGATVLELNRTNSPANADSIVAAVLVRGGTLTVTNVGDALQAGDTFTLFNATSASGTFSATNLPALGAGLAWTNTLSVNGKLSVISTGPVPQPHITAINLSGTSLVINGTNALAGEQYHVLTSTNLTQPLAGWTVLPGGTFSGGNFSITNTVNPGAPQNFYIIRVP